MLFTTKIGYDIIFKEDEVEKMNQILATQIKKRNEPTDIRKVVKFFAIAIILFGMIVGGEGIYSVISNSNNGQDITGSANTAVPKIDLARQEDTVTIKVSSQTPISKVVYHWNEETESMIPGEGKTDIAEKITLPTGTNILYVTVIDSTGKETQFQKEYIVEGDGKPTIDLMLVDNKIKIVAKDEQALSYVTYSWNGQEEVKIEAPSQETKEMEQQIEVPLGQNTLKVTVVNKNNISSAKELEVKGVRKPTVTVLRDGDSLYIKAEDEQAMAYVEYTLNGKKYKLDFGETKVIEYRQALFEGENILKLKAYNKEGGIAEFQGKATK